MTSQPTSATALASQLMNLADQLLKAGTPPSSLQKRWRLLLDGLLSHPSPAQAQAVHDEYIRLALSDEQGQAFLSLFEATYKGLSEQAREGESPYRLFALPMLLPAPNSNMALSPSKVAGVVQALCDQKAITDREPCVLLPLLVPVSYLAHFSEWLVARVGRLLALGDTQGAQELVRTEVEKLQAVSSAPSRQAKDSLTFGALIGVVLGQEDLFPLDQELEALRMDTTSSEELIDQELSAALAQLETLSVELREVLQTDVLEVFNEPQGFWSDLLLCEADMRDMALRQQVQDLLVPRGLTEQDALAGYQAQAYEGLSGVYLTLYSKVDLQQIGELYFPALRFETPDDCAQEALAVLANHGVTLVPAALLCSSPGGEGADRPQGWLH